MDRRWAAPIWIAVLLLASCGSEKTGGGEARPAPAAKADEVAPTVPDGSAAEAKPGPAKAAGRRVVGTAIEAAEGGPAAEGRIEVAIGEVDGRASGTLELDGRTIALEGVFDGEHLRLWATADAGDPEAVRRGYVLGRAGSDDTLSGDFALSDSGGAWSIRGTWKSAR